MKQILIKGCHECGYKERSRDFYVCEKTNIGITDEVDFKTIHPDCPLDDVDEQGGWISVEDRLPKVNKLVLIYSTIRAVDIASLGRFGESWWVNTGKSFQYNEYEKVTHWQPLPEKPKVGK
jgi:hypothetical protein